MKIYVVTQGENAGFYSDYKIATVCDDEQKAKILAEKLCGQVEVFDTDDAKKYMEMKSLYTVTFNCRAHVVLDCKKEPINSSLYASGAYAFLNKGEYKMRVYADSEDEATEIVRTAFKKIKEEINSNEQIS